MQYTVSMHSTSHKVSLYIKALLLVFFVCGIFVLSTRANPKNGSIEIVYKDSATTTSNPLLGTLSIPVLVYHHIRDFTPHESETSREFVVTPAMFEKQMQYLSDNGYTTILVRDVEKVLQGVLPLPEKPVVITFDDGRLSQYENALPVLTKHGMHATFFIFTNAIDANDKYLTSNQIKELDSLGHEIASHTILHPYLTRIGSELLTKELTESKAKLERIVGHEVVSLAYPFGLYDDAVLAETVATGYRYGRTLTHAYDVTTDTLLTMPGFIVTNNFDYFLAIMGGKAK